jgi:hypothetical protein
MQNGWCFIFLLLDIANTIVVAVLDEILLEFVDIKIK